MPNNLITSLNGLALHVRDNIPDLNSGGCCVFAHLVGQHLQRIVPTRVLVADDAAPPNADLEIIREKIDDNSVYAWNAWDVYFGHVLLEFTFNKRRYHFDSLGVIAAMPNGRINYDAEYRIINGHLTVRDAGELANSSGWNTTFNRRHIPSLKRIIDSRFESILSSHGVLNEKRQPREWRYGDSHDRIVPSSSRDSRDLNRRAARG